MASEVELMEREMARRQAVAIRERNAMKKRLKQRDAAYAAQFPSSASGKVRGRNVIGGNVGTRNFTPAI